MYGSVNKEKIDNSIDKDEYRCSIDKENIET